MIGKVFSACGQNRSKEVRPRTVGRVVGCKTASYRRFQYSGAHPLEVMSHPFQCCDTGVETGELLFDGSDDPLLLGSGGEWDLHITYLSVDHSGVASSAHL